MIVPPLVKPTKFCLIVTYHCLMNKTHEFVFKFKTCVYLSWKEKIIRQRGEPRSRWSESTRLLHNNITAIYVHNHIFHENEIIWTWSALCNISGNIKKRTKKFLYVCKKLTTFLWTKISHFNVYSSEHQMTYSISFSMAKIRSNCSWKTPF